MSPNVLQELQGFVKGFLACHDAVVDELPDGLEALLPESLASGLETAEHLRLHFDEDTSENGEIISYGAPLLEKMVAAACSAVPVTACRLEFDYLKGAGFDRLVDECFSFVGARGQVNNQGRTLTDYLRLTLRYTAQSDEQKMGLLSLILNTETGVFVPEMDPALGLVSRQPVLERRDEILSGSRLELLKARIDRLARQQAAEEIASFVNSMQRRYQRDSANLDEYYQGLVREMENSLTRAGLSEQSILERREKIAALPQELARKKDDLCKKYSVRVTLEPVAAMLIRTPVVKILYRLAIGRQHRELTLIYNPVTRTLDPLPCEGCGTNLRVARFCDHQRLLCPACRGQRT